ncbi:hypothetical protein [Nonomuraea aurantiaca]|uniref:hypothetical protein n=1 Tax=Nonomuraea aurantiaca TaxID=2878562 RepID=UPI001CD9D9DE|nr:hypothetical protein [Nonomuraea aurantiaca]MCA2228787.1 hypothetical protein [Nonomuraea aurantiaca]
MENRSPSGLEFAGVFDIHVTLAAGTAIERLASWVAGNGGKLTHIVLARGEVPSQPMLTFTGRGTLTGQRIAAATSATRLREEGFGVVRVKIEAAPWNEDVPQSTQAAAALPGCYFEHHAKVAVRDEAVTLAAIAVRHSAHVSRNARRLLGDGSHERFVTQRCRYVGLPEARRRFDEMAARAWKAGGRTPTCCRAWARLCAAARPCASQHGARPGGLRLRHRAARGRSGGHRVRRDAQRPLAR